MNCGLQSFPGSNVPEVDAMALAIWRARMAARGGFTASTEEIAVRCYARMATRSYLPKVVYFLPLLGASLDGACVPLLDLYGAGPATSVNFAEADYSERTGIQGNGTSKYLLTTLKPSTLNSNLGGLGWWELAFTGSGNSAPIAARDNGTDNRFTLDLRSDRRFFCWGAIANSNAIVNQQIAALNGHWYGQKSAAAARLLALDGSVLASNAGSENTAQASAAVFSIGAANLNGTFYPYPGRCGCAYLTDGTLTTNELTELHADILECLMQPTGRVASYVAS